MPSHGHVPNENLFNILSPLRANSPCGATASEVGGSASIFGAYCPNGPSLPSSRIAGGANGQRRSCAIPCIWILRCDESKMAAKHLRSSTSILQTLVPATLHLPRRRSLPKANGLISDMLHAGGLSDEVKVQFCGSVLTGLICAAKHGGLGVRFTVLAIRLGLFTTRT